MVALAQVCSILVSLLLTPCVLHTLGVELFGLWAFLGSVVAFAGLLQPGLGRGTVRFIAFYSAGFSRMNVGGHLAHELESDQEALIGALKDAIRLADP